MSRWLARDLETGRTAIDNRVRDFYDRHPYPPPVNALDGYQQLWRDEQRRRADYHLFWPAQHYREDLKILVAGCGTSQAARYALRHPAARVVGIDVSSTSIHETEKLRDRYDLTNLEVVQLPIEHAQDLDQQFDYIICTGVLHHLPDPDAGLRALRDVLKPTGAMHLMVYGAYGRVGIYMIQEYCRHLGIDATDEEIDDLAATLMALPQGHPLARLLGEAPDFRNKAALADALLHPQDRAYTVPQVFEFLHDGGLTMGRWLRQAPYLPYCGALAQTPHAARLAQLPEQEQYAAVELLRGTMLRHSLIAYRDDASEPAQPVRFDAGEEWLSYIPHRFPDTIMIEERLPEGAAAVLINQNHTYTDIFLPITSEEKRLVGAIDGRRTITEIMRRTGANQQELVRSLFEGLWRYDQITFDISGR